MKKTLRISYHIPCNSKAFQWLLLGVMGLGALPQVWSQDTLYFDKESQRTFDKANAANYRVFIRDLNEKKRVQVTLYQINGQVCEQENYKDYNQKILDGKVKSWHSNGQLKHEIDYVDGKIEGKIVTYWENGQLKRNETFSNEATVEGKCYNDKGEEILFFPYMVKPYYPGGIEKLYKFVAKNVIYPKEMLKKGIGGKVFVKFIIGKDGAVEETTIVKSLNEAFDRAALEVFKQMPEWDPGYIDGVRARCLYTLPIVFPPDN